MEKELRKYIKSLYRASVNNMRMSTARKGKVCNEKHKVILRNIANEQRDIAFQLTNLVNNYAKG